jgi:gluconate 5-dehydrogenase
MDGPRPSDRWLQLDDAAALVAGAGARGGARAAELAAEGARVAASDHDPTTLDALDIPLTARVVADVRDPSACERAVRQAITALGGLDLLVHAVGINDRRPVLDTPLEVWDQILATNLRSAFTLGREAGRHMCAEGAGRMVFVSSVSGLLAHPAHGPYAASKGGLNQLVKVMAMEWAAHGVQVNAVAPGYIETPLTAAHLAAPGVRVDLTAKIPAGRLGSAADVAHAVTFLCSPRASFITGQVVYVDGGRTLD